MKEYLKCNKRRFEMESIREVSPLLTIEFQNESDAIMFSSLAAKHDPEMYSKNGILIRVFEDYNTTYKRDDAVLILSNDGSIWIEPEPAPEPNPEQPIEPTPEPEPEPYVPSLEEAKQTKIGSLSRAAHQSIIQGVTVDIDGSPEHFSYSEEDQTNIKDAFDLAARTGMDVPYHADEQPCKLYTLEQITNIFVSAKMNLTHHTTYFNQLKMYVMNELDDVDAVDAVQYGDELTGQYLDAYNAMMAQAQAVINALIGTNTEEPGDPTVDENEVNEENDNEE